MNENERTAKLAVALRDVGPETFEHCALIRDWLADLGVDRATLMVAEDNPSFALAQWLRERSDAGDQVMGPVGSGRSAVPGLVRADALLHRGGTLRVDLRPRDVGQPRRTRALERAIRAEAMRRRAVTLAEAGSFAAEGARVLRPS